MTSYDEQNVNDAAPLRVRPLVNHDTEFFWEGIAKGQLLFQRCASCQVLRHPPAPMCPSCQSMQIDVVASRGIGKVLSFTIVHQPAVPPFSYPNAIVLIELTEGVRMISQLIGISPERVEMDMAVQVSFEKVDEELVLPMFRPSEDSEAA